MVVALSPQQQERKMSAILCHRSQLYLSRTRFLASAARPEKFCRAETDAPVRATRTSFFLASLGHAVSLLSRSAEPRMDSIATSPAPEAVPYDPAARHA
jgi:hypothetical protein